jgi:hypothetical protein
MQNPWLQERPHLTALARSMQAVLELADELYERGRGGGDSVDYSAFEERVAQAAAEVEQGVHQVALSGLDVDASYIRAWGKHSRRVHRVARTYCSLAGPVTIERTLYRELGRRRGPSPRRLLHGLPAFRSRSRSCPSHLGRLYNGSSASAGRRCP